jgi:hypothetical protein
LTTPLASPLGSEKRSQARPFVINEGGDKAPPQTITKLLPQVQAGKKASITLDVRVSEICEAISSLTYHLEKTSSGVMILLMNLEMLVKLINPVGKNGYLYFRGTGIARMGSILFDDLLFDFLCNHFLLLLCICTPFPGTGRSAEFSGKV